MSLMMIQGILPRIFNFHLDPTLAKIENYVSSFYFYQFPCKQILQQKTQVMLLMFMLKFTGNSF